MPSTFNPRLEATRRVLSRTPAFGMMEVVDATGKIINKATGVSYDNIQDAVADLSAYQMVDFRKIGSDAFSMGQSIGDAASQSELFALNTYLRSASQAELDDNGLGNLFGQQLDSAYLQYNWGGNKQSLNLLTDPTSPSQIRYPGISVITDEGIMRVSHSISATGLPLTLDQQSKIKSLAGVPTFRKSFVEDFFEDISAGNNAGVAGSLGKLPKRQSRNLAPREVGFDAGEIESALLRLKTSTGAPGKLAYEYDHVDLLLRKAAGDVMTPAEDVLLASTGGIIRDDIFLSADEAFEQVLQYSGLRHPTADVDPLDVASDIRQILIDSLEYRDDSIDPKMPLYQAIAENNDIKALMESTDPRTRILGERLMNLKGDITPANDGSLQIMDGPFRELLRGKRDTLNALKGSIGQNTTGTISSDTLKQVSELEGEIEKIVRVIENHSREENPFTAATADGSFKAEGGLSTLDDRVNSLSPGSSFTGNKKIGKSLKDQIKSIKARITSASPDDMIALSNELNKLERLQAGAEELEQYLIVSPTTNLKSELGSSKGAFITMNVSTKSDKIVFAEPMGLLTDPDYFSPQVRQSVQRNLQETNALVESFFDTGQVPDQVLKDIQFQAQALGLVDKKTGMRFDVPMIPGTNTPETSLDATARGLAKRNRSEIEDILKALESNQDPRKIPAIVNRIRDHYAKGAFRMKDGQVNVALPFDSRHDIRTYESSLEAIPGVTPDGYDVQEVMLKDGTRGRVPFVQASFKGDKMMTTGPVASSMKGVESGYDLDDSFVNSLRTFVDGNGQRRLAINARRDPKGIEELFAVRPNLQSAESVQKIIGNQQGAVDYFLNFGNQEYQNLIDQGYGIDEIVRTLEQAKSILRRDRTGQFTHRTTVGRTHFNSGNELEIFEQMTINAAESVGGQIPEMPDRALRQMIDVQAASHRARGALVQTADGLMTAQAANNLTAEQGGRYGIPNFREIFLDPLKSEEVGNEVLRIVNRKLPSGQMLTVDQLHDFVGGRLLIPGVSEAQALEIGGSAIQELSTTSVMKAALEQKLRNTIGVSSNRGSFSAGSLNMVQQTLEDQSILDQFGSLIPAAQKRYGIGAIPPSNVVDIVKQLSGGNSIRPLDEVLASTSDLAEQQMIRSAYDSIASVVNRTRDTGTLVTADNLHKFQTEIGDVLEAQIEKAAAFLGWTRGAAIAAGKTEGDLPGYDPVAYAERLNIPADRVAERASKISGLRDFLADATLDPVQTSKVEEEIKRLSLLDAKGYEEAITLKPGTPAYERFATSAMARDISVQQEQVNRAQDVIASNMARKLDRPIAVAEYRDISRALLRSPDVSSSFGELKDIELSLRGATMSQPVKAQVDTIKSLISIQMAEGLRAMKEISASGNVLDMIDTLQSEMTSMYGERGSTIFQGLGEEGAEDAMMDIFKLAQERRRLRSQAYDARHFDFVQQLYRDHQGSGVADLLKVDAEQAAQFVTFHKKNPGERVDKTLLSFMEMVSSSGTERHAMRQVVEESAQEAFGQHQTMNALAKIEAEAASTAFPAGLVTDRVTNLKDELGDAVADMYSTPGSIAKSPYKRVMQSFNHGELGKLLESKNVRRSGVAAIALIGASFLYQRNKKKDLTEQDVAGPPLLPGGSAYDGRPPTRDMALQSAQMQSQGYGMQYQVNTTGSMGDLNNLRSLLGGVVDGPINSTMYNGMPSVGKDPYSDIASNF